MPSYSLINSTLNTLSELCATSSPEVTLLNSSVQGFCINVSHNLPTNEEVTTALADCGYNLVTNLMPTSCSLLTTVKCAENTDDPQPPISAQLMNCLWNSSQVILSTVKSVFDPQCIIDSMQKLVDDNCPAADDPNANSGNSIEMKVLVIGCVSILLLGAVGKYFWKRHQQNQTSLATAEKIPLPTQPPTNEHSDSPYVVFVDNDDLSLSPTARSIASYHH